MILRNLCLLPAMCWLCSVCFVLYSCEDKDETEGIVADEPEADYTVMLYGCGGGNLDEALIYNLGQVTGYGYTPKVQFTALVKYSAAWQAADNSWKGTRLYTLTADGMKDEQAYGQGYRLDNPEHIADFIRDTKKRLPAKKYILVLWNHGDEFGLRDQPLGWSDYNETDTRILVGDDNCTENGIISAISIYELEEGLKRAGGKLDMIYWDVCLMNMVENLYQVKDYADYALGSAHLTPNFGGNYASLMHALQNHKDILPAMQEYIPATIEHLKDLSLESFDLTLIDLGKLEVVAERFKAVSDGLLALRQRLEAGSQDALAYDYYQKYYLYKFAGMNSVDLLSSVRRMANKMLDGELSAYVSELAVSVKEMIAVQDCLLIPADMSGFSVGLCWMKSQDYKAEYKDFYGFSHIYPLLRFDQVTGWSNYLKANDMKNVRYDKATGLFYEE